MVLGGEDGRSNLRCGAKGGRQTLIKVVQRPAIDGASRECEGEAHDST